MSALSQDTPQHPGGTTGAQLDQVERSLIDASARTPVLFFYSTALFWLLLQTVIGFIVTLKIQWPTFLEDCSWLTYGRLVPAQKSIALYGWASLAGIGTALWILARLCRVLLPRPGSLVAAGALWNVAVAIGTVAILSGNGRGYEYLDFPRYVFGLMFVAYSVIAVWGIVLFVNRRPGHVYISVWYLVGALFWFPWLVGGINLLINNGTGVSQAVAGAWFAQNILSLWLGALGLGVIYYLIPKVTGRPIHSYNLAALGFWTFSVFSVWGGVQRLIGAPVPAWMITVSIVSIILMLIPVATVTVNYYFTMRGDFNLVYHSPTIRFAFFGAIAYTLANVILLIGSFRDIGIATQFSWFRAGVDGFFLYAFFSMVMFAAMYYIIPRLVGCEWLSATFIKLHFWGVAYGFGFAIVMLLMAGFAQGSMQLAIHQTDNTNAIADFMLSVNAFLPFVRGQGLAFIPLCIGQLVFALHFLLMLLRLGRPSGTQPTLFEPLKEGAK